MKMSPDYVKAQTNMAPGVISAGGFLGRDSRPIADIVEADEEKLQSLGITFEQLAERMQYLLEEGRKGLGEGITVDGKWVVLVNEARGFLPCPFEDGVFRKITATVTHSAIAEHSLKNQSVCFSMLSLHLLEVHHFLQGRGSAFRLEPTALKAVMDL